MSAPLELTVVPKFKPPVPETKARDIGGVHAVRSEDANQKWGSFVGLLVCVVLAGVAFAVFFNVIEGPEGFFAYLIGFGGLICVAIGIAALKAFVKALRIEAVFKRAELLLADWPVAPGETVTARFHQQLKDSVALNAIHGRLYIRETACYRVGTDTHTATEETPVDAFDAVAADGSDGILRADYELKIPVDAACSFKSQNNELAWILEVVVDAEGFPDAKSAFPIRVADAARS